MLAALAIISLFGRVALSRETPKWKPRLFVTATGAVWSPGGIDKDRFAASLGGGASLIYWFNWNTQLMLTGAYRQRTTTRASLLSRMRACEKRACLSAMGSALVGIVGTWVS